MVINGIVCSKHSFVICSITSCPDVYVRYHALAAALATTIAQNTDSTTPRESTLCTIQGREEEAGVEVEKVELGWSGLGKVP